MLNMNIRTESSSDFDQVYELHLQAFEQIDEPELVDKLRLSDRFIPELSIVAEEGDQIIGHILFTKVFIQSAGINKEALALAPMAVLPEYQFQGIGGKLIDFGKEVAKSLGFESVCVLGHNHYYPRFGFVPAAPFNIKSPWNVPDELFMVLELKKDALMQVHGLINYAEPFMEL